jgi:carbonic anhydrase
MTGNHFTYEEQKDWGEICIKGIKQSPININTTTTRAKRTNTTRKLNPRKFQNTTLITWKEKIPSVLVEDNGHTFIVNESISSLSTINNLGHMTAMYDSIQFHFHSPGEHTINKMTYPLELHIVHKITSPSTKKQTLAVLGIMFQVSGKESSFLKSLQMEKIDNNKKRKMNIEELKELTDGNPEMYCYNGSLTTPDCSEIVSWFVIQKPLSMSEKQLDYFTKKFPHYPNNRDIQKLNGRQIYCTNCKGSIEQ